MSKLTKTIFIIALIFLVYGYACRMLSIFFFWESKPLGWIIAFMGLASFLFDVYKSRRRKMKSTMLVKIAMVFCVLGLGVIPVIVIALEDSEAYEAATFFLSSDSTIKSEVGNINAFGLFPWGRFSQTSINDAVSGDAEFTIIIKGDKKFKEVIVSLKKTPDIPWTVWSVD